MSLILLAPSWGGMINGMMTLSGAWHKLRDDPILRFLVVSLAFYGMSTFEGPMMAIKTVAQVVVTAVQCQVALVDAVHADILASHAAQAATVEHGTGGVAVLQAADLVGQARVGVAIECRSPIATAWRPSG